MLEINASEKELVNKRNNALWRSIRHMGDPNFEAEYKAASQALSKAAFLRRQAIESNIHNYQFGSGSSDTCSFEMR